MVLNELIVNVIIGFIFFANELTVLQIKEWAQGVILVKFLSLVECTNMSIWLIFILLVITIIRS